MSTASKITFGLTCLFTVTSIITVHTLQRLERETLHQGPINDAKRREERKKNPKGTSSGTFGTASSSKPSPNLTDEDKKRKQVFNDNDHKLQQRLTQEYSNKQPLTGQILTQNEEIIKKG